MKPSSSDDFSSSVTASKPARRSNGELRRPSSRSSPARLRRGARRAVVVARRLRKAPTQRGLVLDAGAFIALEKRSGHVATLLASLIRADVPLVTSAGVIAQI